jgi:hypothetical protein
LLTRCHPGHVSTTEHAATTCTRDTFLQALADKAVADFCDKWEVHTEEFVTYFKEEWGKKTWQWMAAGRNIPHCNQETNNLVESYHGVLKMIQLVTKRKNCRRLDWLVWKLVTDVLLSFVLKL